jgi:hypothetical protein
VVAVGTDPLRGRGGAGTLRRLEPHDVAREVREPVGLPRLDGGAIGHLMHVAPVCTDRPRYRGFGVQKRSAGPPKRRLAEPNRARVSVPDAPNMEEEQ